MPSLLILLLILFSFPIFANNQNCLLSKYETYVEAQTNWQHELTKLIIKTNPELQSVAELYLADQLNAIEKRKLAVTLLINDSPQQLNVEKKVNGWLQLDEAAENKLANRHSGYKKLLNTVNATKNREPHKDGDKLRSELRTHIMSSVEFKTLYSAFKKKVDIINNTKCK